MEFPNWPKRGVVAIDLETHDPDLKKKGPGVRTNGHSIGYALAFRGFKSYYAFGHNEGNNTDKHQLVEYCKDQLRVFDGQLIFANGLYDLDYMAEDGVHVPDRIPIRDVQIAEPLLDDNALRYNLERLANKYVGKGKSEQILIDLFGAKFKERMREIDAGMVAEYASDDAELTRQVYLKQAKELQDAGLWDLFELESGLTPMLLYMRRLGVRIDVKKADTLSNSFFLKERALNRQLRELTGIGFGDGSTVWQASELAKAFDKVGIEYPLTPKTNKPSITKNWLEGIADDVELARLIVDTRNINKLNGTFLQNALLGTHIDGLIHTTFNQVRNDEGGAVTGRFSSCHPNLQQIPSRDEILAPMIRGLFIPEPGYKWSKWDYSQIEYRLLVHYACLRHAPGAMKLKRQYTQDAKTDYHKFVQDLVKELLGKEIPRRPIKNINFGLIYGMGMGKLSRSLRMEGEELEAFMAAYHAAMPFATFMKNEVTAKAARTGYIRTLLGRRRRFERYESRDWDTSKADGALVEDEAIERYGKYGIRRAWTYKALNALIQGSAADLMKKAMLDVWKSGVCSCHGGPVKVHLTVHDELDSTFPDTKEGREGHAEIGRIMETAYDLEIPIVADGGVGANWAEAGAD